jgi:hypothetical protein
MDPVLIGVLTDFIRTASPDANGNRDNVAIVIATWVSTLADCTGKRKPYKVVRKFFRMLQADYGGMVKQLSDLYLKLVSSVVTTADGIQKESLHKEFFRLPVFREYKQWYDTDDDKLLRYLGTFLLFGKKAEFRDPSLETKALANWLSIESDLCRLDPPIKLIEDLRYILGTLPNPDFTKVMFKFGPGKVSERGVNYLSDKLRVRYHPGLDSILSQIAGNAPGLRVVIPDPYLWRAGELDKDDASIEYATFKLVVKDKFSMRSICKEPNTVMFGQQGTLPVILDAIERSPFGGIIDITDQSRNASLALQSSIDLEYDTIDMKDSSDRASNRVMKQIFPPAWNELFQSLRTSEVKLPNGRIKTVAKFAPMGSAHCFPVQTLVFAAVTTLARFIVAQGITYAKYLTSDYLFTDVEAWIDPKVCVYGDDIIVHRHVTDTVMSILEAIGFRINLSKSFYGNRVFRESCGTFAMRGTDVTPLLFKVKGLLDDDLKQVAGLLSLCNRLFLAGLYNTHAFLSGCIPRQFYVEVSESVYDPLQPMHLLSVQPDNTALRSEYNSSLQRTEYMVKTYSSEITDIVDEDDNPTEAITNYRLARFLQGPLRPVVHKLAHLDSRSIPPYGDVEQPTCRWVWIPAKE